MDTWSRGKNRAKGAGT